MQEILPCCKLISGKSGAEPAQGTFADGLVFKTRCMKRVLEPEIELSGSDEFFVRETLMILQNQRTDQNVDR